MSLIALLMKVAGSLNAVLCFVFLWLCVCLPVEYVFIGNIYLAPRRLMIVFGVVAIFCFLLAPSSPPPKTDSAEGGMPAARVVR